VDWPDRIQTGMSLTDQTGLPQKRDVT
jgi:hypothetical protein